MVQGKQSAGLDPVGASDVFRFGMPHDARSVLDQRVLYGVRQMLQAALEDEVNALLEANASKTDQEGRRLVVRIQYAWMVQLFECKDEPSVCPPATVSLREDSTVSHHLDDVRFIRI